MWRRWGLCVGIRHGLYQSVMVYSGDNAQLITVQLNGANYRYSTGLILAYGPQENEVDDVKDILSKFIFADCKGTYWC